MSKALVYPRVYRSGNNGNWIAEMVDKEDNETVWAEAESDSRNGAIALARKRLPEKDVIREERGWIVRHPFITGAAIGFGATLLMTADDDGCDFGTAIVAGLVVGTAALIVRNCLVPKEEI